MTDGQPDALRHCAVVTRREAANFYYGIRLLPRPKREALYAIYAFARRVDDIGDGDLAPAEKLAALDRAARMAGSLGSDPTDPVDVALGVACARYPLPANAFIDLIEGVRTDVLGAPIEEFAQLELYCRRVAGSIGRLCLAVFGGASPEATALADDLGVALQLTNILRDIREDALNGRVYLPLEDLRRFGWPGGDASPAQILERAGEPAGADRAFVSLLAFQTARAGQWFERGLRLVPMLDRRSGACVLAMSGIYRRLLAQIEAEPQSVLERRLSLSGREKAVVAARSLLGALA
jgi:phytoene synthase